MISPLSRQLDAGQPINWAHGLNRGRLAWWLVSPAGHPSYRGGSRWMDLCRGKSHGTLTNGPAWRGGTRPGGWGCLAFDGTDDYAEIGKPAVLDLSGSASAFCWVHFLSGTTNRYFVADFDAGGTQSQGSLSLQAGPVLGYYHGPSGGSTSGATTLVSGRWYHVGFSRDHLSATKTVQLYLDGRPEGTPLVYASGPSTQANCGNRRLGRAGNFTTHTNCLLDDVSFWNRPLPAGEAWALYDLSRRGYPGVLRRVARRFALAAAAAVSPPRCVGDDGPDLGWLAA